MFGSTTINVIVSIIDRESDSRYTPAHVIAEKIENGILHSRVSYEYSGKCGVNVE